MLSYKHGSLFVFCTCFEDVTESLNTIRYPFEDLTVMIDSLLTTTKMLMTIFAFHAFVLHCLFCHNKHFNPVCCALKICQQRQAH